MIDYLVAFFGMVIFDVAYALFNRALARNKIASACIYSGLLTGIGGLVIIEYADNHIALLFACLGSIIGTYIGVWFDNKYGDGKDNVK